MIKKVFVLCLILMIGFTLFGCTDRTYVAPEKVETQSNVQTPVNQTTTGQSVTQTETKPTVEVLTIGDKVSSKDLILTLNSVTYVESIGEEYFVSTPKSGNIYAVLDLTFENISTDKEKMVNLFDMGKIYDDEKYSYDIDFMATTQLDKALKSDNLLPGRTVRGQVAYEVPKDASKLELEIPVGSFSLTKAVFKLK
jgi:hypothetical protein